jgi:hypothetical protein
MRMIKLLNNKLKQFWFIDSGQQRKLESVSKDLIALKWSQFEVAFLN